ncbi:hypothetical protein GN956_G13112 [Arapaima gigas]
MLKHRYTFLARTAAGLNRFLRTAMETPPSAGNLCRANLACRSDTNSSPIESSGMKGKRGAEEQGLARQITAVSQQSG